MYTPLNPQKREIRICHVTQDRSKGIPHCTLELVSLDASPAYAALSYVWGDETVHEDIVVNGQRKSVTYNLSRALREFENYGPHIVWIDALCINQADDVEKSHQVAIMGDIYRSAEIVKIWLGEIPSGIDNWDRIGASDIICELAEGRCLEGVKALRMSHNKYISLAGESLRLFRSIVDPEWFERA